MSAALPEVVACGAESASALPPLPRLPSLRLVSPNKALAPAQRSATACGEGEELPPPSPSPRTARSEQSYAFQPSSQPPPPVLDLNSEPAAAASGLKETPL